MTVRVFTTNEVGKGLSINPVTKQLQVAVSPINDNLGLDAQNNLLVIPVKTKKLTAAITKAVNAAKFALSDLAITVKAGEIYRLSYYLLVRCSYPYSGSGVSFDFPTGAMNLLVQRVRRQNWSPAYQEGYITTTGDVVKDARTYDTNKPTPIHVTGMFACTADGVVTPYVETAGFFGNLTVSDASYVLYERVA